MDKKDALLILEENYTSPITKVWAAITEVEQMRQWFFADIPDFSPTVGFHTEFDVQAPSRIFRHLWTITEAEPPHRITYKWHYTDCPGLGYVTFELTDMDVGVTRCRLVNSIIESYPSELPEFKRESAMGGWTHFLGQLKEHLAKN